MDKKDPSALDWFTRLLIALTFGLTVAELHHHVYFPEEQGVVQLLVWLLGGTGAFLVFDIWLRLLFKKRQAIEAEKIQDLQEKVDKQPEKIKPAWDLARVKLEAYFDRNLRQVSIIFYVAVAVMIVGFSFVLWGLRVSVQTPGRLGTAIMASGSGIITQFIGATFMFLYRNTMLQANQFMQVLERINRVGMAVGILDSIRDGEEELKDSTRVEMIKLLLAADPANRSVTKPKKQRAAAASAE